MGIHGTSAVQMQFELLQWSLRQTLGSLNHVPVRGGSSHSISTRGWLKWLLLEFDPVQMLQAILEKALELKSPAKKVIHRGNSLQNLLGDTGAAASCRHRTGSSPGTPALFALLRCGPPDFFDLSLDLLV